MTREELELIFEDEDCKWEGDNALQGLIILQKYVNKGKNVLEGANHDIIYGPDIDKVLEKITREDAIALRNLNWMLDSDNDCFACFV